MVRFDETNKYLQLLAGAESYLALDTQARERVVFTAYERLSLHYPERLLTPRIVALQAIHMTDGASVEGDEAMALQNLRKAGAKSYSIDGVSVSFDDSTGGTGIAPDVVAYFDVQERENKGRARVGRLV